MQRMLSRAVASHHHNEIRGQESVTGRRKPGGVGARGEGGQGQTRLDAIRTVGTNREQKLGAELDDALVLATTNADEVRQQQRRVTCDHG